MNGLTASQEMWLRSGLTIVGIWIGGFIVLFTLGWILSRVTLVAVGRSQGETIGSSERLVRSIYRGVIFLTSIYFYISIPILVLVVIGVALAVLYFLYLAITTARRVSIRGVLILGALALSMLYTVFEVVSSLFVREREIEPGRPLSKDEAPQLWALTQEVAQRVGTRPVDAIYLTPGTEIAVTERGDFMTKLRDTGQRYLILGLGVLPDMTQGQFKAILAHEYGHFSHRDTAGGDLAFLVQRSIYQMAYGLAMNGLARWYNPAWLFVNGYHRVFIRITLGASRLQEILADRYAAMAYSAQNFIDGLKHVVRQNLIFNLQFDRERKAAEVQQRKMANFYTLPPLDGEAQKTFERYFTEIMKRPTTSHDSHPALKDRIWLVENLSTPEPDNSSAMALDLLPVESLQAEMSEHLRQMVHLQNHRFRSQIGAQRV